MDIPEQKDDLKWFGEGFDGFPKRLPDDCVEYIIYVVDSKLKDAAATRSRLKTVLSGANERSKKLLKDYIWQRDSFQLVLDEAGTNRLYGDVKDDSKGSVRLRGRTRFGDSVADEWLIVYLLLELSKQFSDAWIRVYDTDGEFLLIEAANALPKWLNPEIAENRVWINNGHLRIIPTKENTAPKNLSIQEALDFILSKPEKLVISPFVEDEAFHRLKEYPAAINASLHHSMLNIPRRLAYILHSNPSYISPAIEAFYLRDPISLRPLNTKDTSSLHFPPEDFVMVSVKFTKVGFAQLRSQEYVLPPAWTGVLPHMSDPKWELGMKLTCGFEMIMSDPQNRDKRVVREMKLLLEDVEGGDEALPANAEVETWPKTADDEKWLDINYQDFENELSGKKKATDGKPKDSGFGDPSAQENLRKMVERFEDFIKDDNAGPEGADDLEDMDYDNDSDSEDSEEDRDGSYSKEEFEKAMREMMGFDQDFVEKSGLLDEARKLALEDGEDGEEIDEDEEMKKVMELMEKELKGHGALNLNPKPPQDSAKIVTKGGKAKVEDADEEVERDLSSDDEEEFNDVDLGLVKNMLEAFKGQAGGSGPAGNLMEMMGVTMPRDEHRDGDDE